VFCCLVLLGTSATDSVVTNSAAAVSKATTFDGGTRKSVAGNVVPTTLLLGSSTEFDLQCDTDADFEKPAKRLRHCDDTAAIASHATDSDKALVDLATSSSLKGVENAADVSDTDDILSRDNRAAVNVATEDVFIRTEHTKNSNKKASHSSFFAVLSLYMWIAG